FVQGDDVSHYQADKNQRHSNDVEGEETVQGGVRDNVIAANPEGQFRPDEWDGREQVHNNLSAPVRHLAPGQQIPHEGFSHEGQEDGHTEDPDQLTRLAVRAVEQATQHMQVNHHEEHGGAGGVHVADYPSPGYLAHDVFDRVECQIAIGLVVHYQEDAGDYLDDEHEQSQRTKKIPEV